MNIKQDQSASGANGTSENKTNQPAWKLVAQLGDRNPTWHGGYFVYVDENGIYQPEAEYLISPEEENESYLVYRFILEPCTFIKGVLSDNKFHPDHPAWFQKSMGTMCNCMGTPLSEFVDMICNGNIESRARAWEMIGLYHGFENLDNYPLKLTREEAEARFQTKI